MSSSSAALDFSGYIAERTKDFTGREWVFAEIDGWLAGPKGSQFFLPTGEPGSGKSGIAARMVQTRPVLYRHSNAASGGKRLIPEGAFQLPLPLEGV